MTEESGARAPRTATGFISGEDEVPHPLRGAIPIYPDGIPPETVLPGYRCPHCDERMPSLRDLWSARRKRDRLAAHREEHEFDTEEWDAFNEGVHHFRREIDRMLWALPAGVSSWASSVTDPLGDLDTFDPNGRWTPDAE